MREILFRGKREADGGWIYGYYSDDSVYGTDFPCIAPRREYDDDGDWAIIPETVGQYTGLKDKNGRKIFEGDILESRYNADHPEDYAREEVIWKYNGWCIRQLGSGMVDAMDDDGQMMYSEVIGNIHDNPELLSGGGNG